MARAWTSMRVDTTHSGVVRRDGVDQTLVAFMKACGLLPLVIPNDLDVARGLITDFPAQGLILAGGNDLIEVGGTAPEREEVEAYLLQTVVSRGLPTLAICRGMQFVFARAGLLPERIEGHVGTRHAIQPSGREVNSFHGFGFKSVPASYEELARCSDGSIEAARDSSRKILALMWHPDRETPFAPEDVELVRSHFSL